MATKDEAWPRARGRVAGALPGVGSLEPAGGESSRRGLGWAGASERPCVPCAAPPWHTAGTSKSGLVTCQSGASFPRRTKAPPSGPGGEFTQQSKLPAPFALATQGVVALSLLASGRPGSWWQAFVDTGLRTPISLLSQRWIVFISFGLNSDTKLGPIFDQCHFSVLLREDRTH